MKKIILQAVLFGMVISFSACGNGDAEKKAQEAKEIMKMDSLKKVVQDSEADLDAKKEDLEKSLEELKDIAPKGK